MTDIEKIEKAADEYRNKELPDVHIIMENARTRWADQDFKAGVRWRDANPSPKVQELVRALEWIMPILHGEERQFAEKALANFRKEG